MKETSTPAIDSALEATRYVYRNWREGFVRPMLIGALILGLFALIPALLTNQGLIQNTVFITAYILLIVVTFTPLPYWTKMGTFLFIVYGLGLSELFSTGILGDSIFFFLGLIVFATMMFSPRAGSISTIIVMATFGLMAWLTSAGYVHYLSPDAMTPQAADWLSTAATTLLFSVTIILGLRQLQNEFLEAQKRSDDAVRAIEAERENLEASVAERTVQLKAVNEVGRAANAILDPEELISRVVNLITDQFGYYYTALFLLDDKAEWAELHNATGEAGRVLKENKHRLRIDANSMVGSAISTLQPRVALDTDAEANRFKNPLLPYTRSEIALPLIAGTRVLGALDVQSTKAGAFSPQEIEVLQSMASQVAIAFENARLFERAGKSIEELQIAQRQYVLSSWESLPENENLQYKVGDDELSSSAAQLEIPLSLRDAIIGQISLAGDDEWTPEQRTLVEAVATQAALALENARLVEESQSTAAQEHLLAEITGKIWSSGTIEGVLQSAVRELGRALDASDATIELKLDGEDG